MKIYRPFWNHYLSTDQIFILLGYFSAHICKEVITGVKEDFNKEKMNVNDELMINFSYTEFGDKGSILQKRMANMRICNGHSI